jgi:uracil-DNA glycosylase
MTIEEYFGDWSSVVDLKEADGIMRKLSASKTVICPGIHDVFKAFRLCSFHDLRCVLIGQDPYSDIYHGKPRATGLAFANSSDTPEKDYSPSLEILRESIINYTIPHGTIIFEPDLEKWETQGVLLLNSALSCEVGRTGSHTLLWRPFITSFLTNLSRCSAGIVYVLMGSNAQSLEPYISPGNNHIIRIRHPSYYARTRTRMPSDIWKDVNQILISQNGYGIEWYQEY